MYEFVINLETYLIKNHVNFGKKFRKFSKKWSPR